MDFPEADWKILRRVHAAALERFCERVLSECKAVLDEALVRPTTVTSRCIGI
jgi:hypothetical protein